LKVGRLTKGIEQGYFDHS